MLLQDSRRDARTGPGGELVLLDEQDRGLWHHEQIEEGLELIGRLPPGPYALQAAIAAEHARAVSPEATDWARIADLYALLARTTPSPVVELNRAVAVAMSEGEERGLELTDLTPEQLPEISSALTPEVLEVLSVAGSIESRSQRGGTASAQVRIQLGEVEAETDRQLARLAEG